MLTLTAAQVSHSGATMDNPVVREPKKSGRRSLSPEELMEEARRVAADPADRAETQAVRKDMDAIAAPWPDDDLGVADRPRREAD